MSRSRRDNVDDFPERLGLWLEQNGDLLDALVTLRRLGGEGGVALDAVLGVRRVAVMRASLALWSALVDNQGHDPAARLIQQLPANAIDHLRSAIGDVQCTEIAPCRAVSQRGQRGA